MILNYKYLEFLPAFITMYWGTIKKDLEFYDEKIVPHQIYNQSWIDYICFITNQVFLNREILFLNQVNAAFKTKLFFMYIFWIFSFPLFPPPLSIY